jgi:hypothetical protein
MKKELTKSQGLKVYALDIPQNQPGSFGTKFMWEGDIPLSANNVTNSNAYYQHPLSYSLRHQIQGFPDWQLVQYLPLVEDGYSLYGITVFCTSSGGMSGIGGHFRSNTSYEKKNHWIGNQRGSPIHFRLGATEYITSVWIRYAEKIQYFGPFLTVRLKSY